MNAHRANEAGQPDAHGQGKRHDFDMSRSIRAENRVIHRLIPLWHPQMSQSHHLQPSIRNGIMRLGRDPDIALSQTCVLNRG